MAIPFYDNLEGTLVDDVSCIVEVERVYGFDWGSLRRRALEGVSAHLPGLAGGDTASVTIPYWFGDDEDFPPFLRRPVVPPGLQFIWHPPRVRLGWHGMRGFGVPLEICCPRVLK